MDVSFYRPLVSYYNQELTNWLKNQPRRVITYYKVASLFNAAYIKAATIPTALSGFSISPFNDSSFPDWMFAAAEVTDNKENEVQTQDDNPMNPTSTPTRH